jgi:NhaP-type Na+/H+ or K+/H+ antiporter
MVDGESLLNDGTGLVLFAIAVQASSRRSARRGVVTFVGTVALSVAIGSRPASRGAIIGLVDDHLDRADDLGRARLRQLHARRPAPPVRRDSPR